MTVDHATGPPGRRHELLVAGPLTIDELTEQRGWRCPGLTTTLNIVYR